MEPRIRRAAWLAAVLALLGGLQQVPFCAASGSVKLLALEKRENMTDIKAILALALGRINNHAILCHGDSSACSGTRLELEWMPEEDTYDATVQKFVERAHQGGFAGVLSGDGAGPLVRTILSQAEAYYLPALSYAQKMPHTEEYGYFFRSAVSHLDIPTVILLTIGHLQVPEVALMVTSDAILPVEDFTAAHASLADRGATIPKIVMSPLIHPRTPGEPCDQHIFSELSLVRQMRLRVVIADVDQEDLLRCLLCAGHITTPTETDDAEEDHLLVWFTIGTLQHEWWYASDPTIADSRVYSPGTHQIHYLGGGELVGDRCEPHTLRRMASFHVNVAPQQSTGDPATTWPCGDIELGTIGDIWDVAGEYAHFSGIVVDALCVGALVFGDLLGTYTVSQLNAASKEVVRSFSASAHDPRVVNYAGASAQVLRYEDENYPRSESLILVHQLQSSGNWTLAAEWWHLGYGVLSQTDLDEELEFPGEYFLPEEETVDVPVVEEEDDSNIDRDLALILASGAAGLLFAVVIGLYMRRRSENFPKLLESAIMEEADVFLSDMQGHARMHHCDEQRIWRALPSRCGRSMFDSAHVSVFVCVDVWYFQYLDISPDGPHVRHELEKSLIPALVELCKQEHLQPSGVRFCISHSGHVAGRSALPSDSMAATRSHKPSVFTMTGINVLRTESTSKSRCCCLRRRKSGTALRQSLQKDALSTNPFRQIAFAVDEADYFLLVKSLLPDKSDRKSNSRLSAPADGACIDGMLDCSEDTGRAFACLCALAMKPPAFHFNYDGARVRRSLTQEDLASLVKFQSTTPCGLPSMSVRECLGDLSMLERARLALLQVWSAAISHGNPEFIICMERCADEQEYGKYSSDHDNLLSAEDCSVRSVSSAVRKRLELSDLPVYLPIDPPADVPTWAIQSPDFFGAAPPCASRMPLQEVHGSHDRAALHSHRKAVVQLVRALRQNFAFQLDCTLSGFVAPSKHARAVILVESLKYFDRQLQNNAPSSRKKRCASDRPQVRVASKTPAPEFLPNAMGSPVRSIAEMTTNPPDSECDIVLGVRETLEYCHGRFSFAEIGQDSRTLRDLEASPHHLSSQGSGAQIFKMQDVLRKQLKSTVKKAIQTGPSSGFCRPGSYQCKGCLAARRRREADSAVRALEPQVEAYMLSFLRTVEGSMHMQEQAVAKIEDEMRNGYRAVYTSVLGLIREEDEYESLIRRVDDILYNTLGMAAYLANPATLVDLISAAHVHHQRLQVFCRDLARCVCEVSGDAPVSELHTRGGLDLEKVPPPKGCWRILEKNALEPGLYRRGVFADNISTLRCFDAARSTIICRDCKGMLKVVELLVGDESPVRVCRGKNRLRKPSEGGWADILYNVVWKDDPSQHVMEIQLVHVKLMMIRHSHAFKGHDRYGEFRAAMEVSEVLGLALPQFPPIEHRLMR